MFFIHIYFLLINLNLAGTLGNRTQLLLYQQDNDVEDREGHQPPNHSHIFTKTTHSGLFNTRKSNPNFFFNAFPIFSPSFLDSNLTIRTACNRLPLEFTA